MFNFGQPRRSGACPGQRVDLGDRKRARERLAVGARLQAVAGALLAVARCGFPVPGGLRAMLGGLHAVLPGALALPGGAQHDLGAGDRGRVVAGVVGVSLRHREIARGGSTISRLRRQIASRSGRVAFLGALQARAGGLLALERRVPPDLTTGLIISEIDAVREVAIGGGLIAIGGDLVAVGA
ncbi:MAG: hypothetical protein ABSG43_10575 [Solirubrobacteraceae bacterium]